MPTSLPSVRVCGQATAVNKAPRGINSLAPLVVIEVKLIVVVYILREDPPLRMCAQD